MLGKIRNLQYTREKKRFLLFAFLLLLTLFLAIYLLRAAYARYELGANIYANVDKALYIFKDEKMSFNIDSEGIIPSNDPYVYSFSVSNFSETAESDVDLAYHITITTTTNLPINLRLYRNQQYNATGATNLFSGSTLKQDADSAWYRVYEVNNDYEMYYVDNTTDVYYLVIDFPLVYANTQAYANYLESIEVSLESYQLI